MSVTSYLLVPLAGLLAVGASVAPDITNYGSVEAWARMGIAGLSLLCLFVMTNYTNPKRDKQKDASHTENIKAVVESSDKKMEYFVAMAERANDKICGHLSSLEKEVANGNQDAKRLLLAVLTTKPPTESVSALTNATRESLKG